MTGPKAAPPLPNPPPQAEEGAHLTWGRSDVQSQHLPVRAGALELASVDRCMYDMTPDEDFILDHLPGADAVILGSGFSGHGFKFGPLIGELLAALALDQEPAFPLERFRASRFSIGDTDAAVER